MNKNLKIDRYYENIKFNRVFKCIDREDNVYLFKRVDGGKYSNNCGAYDKSSKLCKKCNNKTVCSKYSWIERLNKEVPRLKAILLYGE